MQPLYSNSYIMGSLVGTGVKLGSTKAEYDNVLFFHILAKNRTTLMSDPLNLDWFDNRYTCFEYDSNLKQEH